MSEPAGGGVLASWVAARTILVRLALDGGSDPAVVVSALSMLLDGVADVRLVFVVTPDQLTETTVARVQEMVMAAPPQGRFPDAELVSTVESAAVDHLLEISAGFSPAEDARAVVLLGALVETFEESEESPPPVAASPPAMLPRDPGLDSLPSLDEARTGLERRVVARATRARAELARAVRDLGRAASPTTPVRICVVSQQATSWGAVQTVCDAWRVDERVQLSVVALPGAGLDPLGAARVLGESGYTVRDAAWLEASLTELDVVVLEAPYDGFRPAGLHAEALASSGVRLAYVPYGTNVGGGDLMERWAFDLPLHQLAWRMYVRSETQVAQFRDHCSVGADHLRLLGTPKTDRTLRGRREAIGGRWSGLAGDRTVVVWNPHYTVPATAGLAWSTYHLHVGTMVDLFARHRDHVLIARPHFQLFPTLRRMGADGARLEARLRDAVAEHENILLDEAPDYEDTMAVADVLVSDASSLIAEFMPTGRPIIYTPRSDGAGLSRDAAYIEDLYRAESAYELRRDLSMLMSGKDPRRGRRAASIARHFAHEDGCAGARIADDVVTACLQEWGLS